MSVEAENDSRKEAENGSLQTEETPSAENTEENNYPSQNDRLTKYLLQSFLTKLNETSSEPIVDAENSDGENDFEDKPQTEQKDDENKREDPEHSQNELTKYLLQCVLDQMNESSVESTH